MCKTLQNHQCPTLPAFVETRNHHAKRCKKVKNVAKKNGDIITIMRHYEYINMKILKTCKVCGKPFVGSKMTNMEDVFHACYRHPEADEEGQ